MTSQHDIAIIGGGVIGVCSAYYLARKGVKVILIEKGEIASGCSYGNGGLIVPSHAVPLASPGALGNGLRWLLDGESPFYIKPRLDLDLVRWLVRFALSSGQHQLMRTLPVLRDLLLASRALYEDLSRQGNFDFGFEGNGSLQVYLKEESLEEGIDEAQLLERFGIPTRIMSASEVLALEPALQSNITGGVYYPRDGHIDPLRFVQGLAEEARELGVEILRGTEVRRLETRDGKVTGIETAQGNFHPKQVVLAAGSWSPGIARELRLRVPIQPAKGYSLTFETPEISPKYPLLLADAHVVLNPLRDALRVAGTLELAGMDFSINMRRVEAIRRATQQYFPALAEARLIETWGGLRPCTPDGLPIISRSSSFHNLIVAAGHAMLGMSLGPITGKLVSQLVCDEKTDVDVSPLGMSRF
jgi:D-amino-acid dehydrogenase